MYKVSMKGTVCLCVRKERLISVSYDAKSLFKQWSENASKFSKYVDVSLNNGEDLQNKQM